MIASLFFHLHLVSVHAKPLAYNMQIHVFPSILRWIALCRCVVILLSIARLYRQHFSIHAAALYLNKINICAKFQ